MYHGLLCVTIGYPIIYTRFNPLHAEQFCMFLYSADVFQNQLFQKINFFGKLFQEYLQSVKQFRSRSVPLGPIWKVYQ